MLAHVLLLGNGACETPQTLCRGFEHVAGHAYSYSIIVPFSKPDDASNRSSTVEIYEDGKPLGPAHRDVQDIVENGAGRFLYWKSSMSIKLFMSASDNSNPNINGRTYTVRDPQAKDPYLRQPMTSVRLSPHEDSN